MTNRTLTALVLRIAGIFLFTKIFDHFGSYFLAIHGAAIIAQFNESLNTPVNKLYLTGTFMTIANIVVSLFLFIKAEWISKKLVKTDYEIKTELNAKSLTKVILLTIGVIWFAKLIYKIPDLIDFCAEFISIMNGNEEIESTDFAVSNYLLKTILTLIIIFRIEKLSNWIVNKI